jgi:hypothetical protein
MTAAGPANSGEYHKLQRWLTLGAVAFSLVYAAIVIAVASPASFYTLDDPFIHMALAENIARGHFGVNLDEVSNPSSSILWPWLLATTERLGVMMWAPLVINIACFVASLRIAVDFCLKRLAPDGAPWPALIFCGLALLSFNLFGVIFTGMEHSLHTLLMIVVVTRAIDGRHDRITFAAMVLAPLVRFEGLTALAFGAGAAIIDRKYAFALISIALTTALMGLYALWLTSLGLPVLPSSVLSKSTLSSGLVDGGGQVGALFANVATNLSAPSMPIFAVLAVTMTAAAVRRAGRDRWLALGMLGVLLLSFLAGKLMGYARYEVYILCTGGLAAVHLFAGVLRVWLSNALRALIIGTVIVIVCLRLGPYVLTTTPAAARNVDRQQHQMHLLLTECWRKPAAINDLGWVAFRNDNYVLDLYGLGSEAARKARAAGEPGWMQKLVDEHDVGLAMLYPEWFPDMPKTWTPVGQIVLTDPAITPFSGTVDILATRPDAIEPIRSCLRQFAPPPGAKVVVFER